MTDTKTHTSKQDREELARELARRKANPVTVEKPVKPARVVVGRNARLTFNGVDIPLYQADTLFAVVTK